MIWIFSLVRCLFWQWIFRQFLHTSLTFAWIFAIESTRIKCKILESVAYFLFKYSILQIHLVLFLAFVASVTLKLCTFDLKNDFFSYYFSPFFLCLTNSDQITFDSLNFYQINIIEAEDDWSRRIQVQEISSQIFARLLKRNRFVCTMPIIQILDDDWTKQFRHLYTNNDWTAKKTVENAEKCSKT